MGVSFWGITIYSIVFVTLYFVWAIRKNRKEEN